MPIEIEKVSSERQYEVFIVLNDGNFATLRGTHAEVEKAWQKLIEMQETKLNREELITRFEKYNFRDSNGHPLINCLDFQMLIDQAVEDSERAKSLERLLCEKNRNA